MAYFHHPRFSSGTPGDNSSVKPLWDALYDADAELVLNGHAHGYERFAPQTPSGALDTNRGIREFVVGTGGQSHHSFPNNAGNTDVRNVATFGVLKLRLDPTS